MAVANLVFGQNVGGRAVVRFTGAAGATANLVIAANSTVNSAIATSNDQITGAAITKVLWSTPNTANGIVVQRGTNLLLTLTGNGNWDLKGMGVSLAEFNTANVIVTLPDNFSTLILEFTKMYPTGSE
jgi:hypothetical protein